MMRTRSLAASLLAFPAAALLALAGAGSANAAPPASNDESKPSVARATADGAGAAEYWTADRMRRRGSRRRPGRKCPGTRTPPQRRREKGKEHQGQGKQGQQQHQGRPAGSPGSPHRQGVLHRGRGNYVCSGNAVTSENQSTVATAGHCLNEGPGTFVDNFIFVPGYEDGQAPYGRWTARDLYTPSQWGENGDIGFDTGFAVVDQNEDGETLTDVVGGSGVEFNAARGRRTPPTATRPPSPSTATALELHRHRHR